MKLEISEPTTWHNEDVFSEKPEARWDRGGAGPHDCVLDVLVMSTYLTQYSTSADNDVQNIIYFACHKAAMVHTYTISLPKLFVYYQ